MKDDYQKKGEEEDDLVDTLIRLPVKNLEERVNELERELEERLKLNSETLARLGTEQLKFEEKSRQRRYNGMVSGLLNVKSRFDIEIAKLEIQKNDEMLSCFRDVSNMHDRLRELTEKLEKEKIKLRFSE